MQQQIDNLKAFIEEQRSIFDEKLVQYNAEGGIDWDADVWKGGQQGKAWLKQAATKNIAYDDTNLKGLDTYSISAEYKDFMKAMVILYTFTKAKTKNGVIKAPSVTQQEKCANIMRRWYHEMVKKTHETHPRYLTSDLIHDAMDTHHENSKSATNVSDYCDVAVTLTKLIANYNLTITKLNCENKHLCRNGSTATAATKEVKEAQGEDTNDDKLISIRAFMSMVELTYLAQSRGEKILVNALMLLIITGFRFQELQSLMIGEKSLIKRKLTGDKLIRARENGWPEYRLGIRYLGAKKAGWRTYWAAPSTNTLIETIFKSVEELTQASRDLIIKFRGSGFTDFLPDAIKELPDDLVEISELEDHVFEGNGGTRGNAGLRRSMNNAFNQKGIVIEPVVRSAGRNKKHFLYTKEQINSFIEQRYETLVDFEDGNGCVYTFTAEDKSTKVNFNFEELLFILPDGSYGIAQSLVTLVNPLPLRHSSFRAWLGGDPKRTSIFDKMGLYEDDESRISLNPHVPRHNINTFLAIAGVTDHLQAMLMGRVDITQNKHYQHRAESLTYQTAALAATTLERAYDESQAVLSKENQLSLFDAEGEPSKPLPAPVEPKGNEVSIRIGALANSSASKPRSGVEAMKKHNAILVDPKLSTEANLKQNTHTVGERPIEVAKYLAETVSDSFLPELKAAHKQLLDEGKSKVADDLLKRHAKLHALEIGACTRDVGQWGCPFGMKCQSGLPCGYFTLIGRMDELEAVTISYERKKGHVEQLRKLCSEDNSYQLALSEQEEALIVFEAFKDQVITSLQDKKLVSLLSDDKDNPLRSIVQRITDQKLIGKIPNTLADLFFIEQKRMERDGYKETK